MVFIECLLYILLLPFLMLELGMFDDGFTVRDEPMHRRRSQAVACCREAAKAD